MARRGRAQFKIPNNCGETVRCIFNLSAQEFIVLKYLVNAEKGLTINELVRNTGKHCATIYRVLKMLMEKGLCRRRMECLPHGGYYYRYYALPVEELKEIVLKCVEDWYNSVMEKLEKFEF